jgi:putative oxidoreductase
MNRLVQNPDLGLFLFRVFVGLAMAFAHGLGKVPPSDQLTQGLAGMGFPLPVVFAWAAALAEFAGGLFIALGLFTRHAAFFLAVTMSVAAFIAHAADPFQKKEMALLYLFASIMLIFTGPGRLSLDSIIRKK